MTQPSKSAAQFVTDDFLLSPVWAPKPEDGLAAGEDESWMYPVSTFPLNDLCGHAVGVEALLADGSRAWVAIFNTWLHKPDLNSQFQSFMFLSSNLRCTWSPSGFFGNVGALGAVAVADFLGKSVDSVFPFTYDISPYARGHHDVLARSVDICTDSPAEEPWEAAIRAATASMNMKGSNES